MVTRTGSGDGGQVLRFRNQNYSTTLEEHAAINTRVITVELENPPAEVTYSIASGNEAQALYINNNGKLFESGHEKMCLVSYVNNKGADQPAHQHSLISAFVVRCLDV